MKNYWLKKDLLEGINKHLEATCNKSGRCIGQRFFLVQFLRASTEVVRYIDEHNPSFRTQTDYKNLNLCHSRGKGFFVEMHEE